MRQYVKGGGQIVDWYEEGRQLLRFWITRGALSWLAPLGWARWRSWRTTLSTHSDYVCQRRTFDVDEKKKKVDKMLWYVELKNICYFWVLLFLNVEVNLYALSWSWQIYVQLLKFSYCDSQWMKSYVYSYCDNYWNSKFTVRTASVDDLEDLVITFMMLLVARLMAEHAPSHRPREIRSTHNSSL